MRNENDPDMPVILPVMKIDRISDSCGSVAYDSEPPPAVTNHRLFQIPSPIVT